MSAFFEGMAEILELEPLEVDADTELGEAWDSLAIVSTIALIDEVYDVTVSPAKLGECATVGEVEALAKAASE